MLMVMNGYYGEE